MTTPAITDEQIAEIETHAHETLARQIKVQAEINQRGSNEVVVCLSNEHPARILSLISRLRAAERDAARYRWLRSENFYYDISTEAQDACVWSGYSGRASRFEDLSWVDAHIDAAMALSEPNTPA